jgi:hypothetical protein
MGQLDANVQSPTGGRRGELPHEVLGDPRGVALQVAFERKDFETGFFS